MAFSKTCKRAAPLLGVMVLLAGGYFAVNLYLLRGLTTVALEQLSGFGIEYDRLSSSIYRSEFRVEGLRLTNPDDFPEKNFCSIHDIYVDYHFWPLLRGSLELKNVELDIAQITVIRRMTGTSNLEVLESGGKPAAGGDTAKAPAELPLTPGAAPTVGSAPDLESNSPDKAAGSKTREERSLRIGKMMISLGTVVYRDYKSGGPEPVTFSMPINRTVVIEDITSAEDLAQKLEGALLGDTLDQFAALSSLNDSTAGMMPGLGGGEGGAGTYAELSAAYDDIQQAGETGSDELDEERRALREQTDAVFETFSTQYGIPKEDLKAQTEMVLEMLSEQESQAGNSPQ